MSLRLALSKTIINYIPSYLSITLWGCEWGTADAAWPGLLWTSPTSYLCQSIRHPCRQLIPASFPDSKEMENKLKTKTHRKNPSLQAHQDQPPASSRFISIPLRIVSPTRRRIENKQRAELRNWLFANPIVRTMAGDRMILHLRSIIFPLTGRFSLKSQTKRNPLIVLSHLLAVLKIGRQEEDMSKNERRPEAAAEALIIAGQLFAD